MKSGLLIVLALVYLLVGSPAVAKEPASPDAIYERIAQVERIPLTQRTLADLVQLGRDYRSTGRPDDAWGQAHAALRLDPDEGSALLLLGDLQFQRGEYRQALATFDRLAQLRPGFPAVQLRRSQTLSAMGLGREAEAANALFLTRSGRVRAVKPAP